MKDVEKLFLGGSRSDQRRFLASAFKWLKHQGFKRVIVPCVGQFSIPAAALSGGFAASELVTSDTSWFSTLIGHVYARKPLEELWAGLPDELTFEKAPSVKVPAASHVSKLDDPLDVASYLLLLLKLSQVPLSSRFTLNYLLEIAEHRERYALQFRKKLEQHAKLFDGIDYRARCMWEEARDEWDEQTVMAINPPAYAKGYDRMFPLAQQLEWSSDFTPFYWAKDYQPWYAECGAGRYLTLAYRIQNLEVVPAHDAIYASRAPKRTDYWITTRPEAFADWPLVNHVHSYKIREHRPYKNAPLWGYEDVLTAETKVQVVQVPLETALYYRDLWAHRLGVTGARTCTLILLDGKVFGTVGWDTQHLQLCHCDYASEVFGFSAPSKVHKNINRLLMTIITCRDMGKLLMSIIAKQNRIYEAAGITTTCLTKYRSRKQSRGLLEQTSREKLPNGMYRLTYKADFRDETFQQALDRYLKEQEISQDVTPELEELRKAAGSR